jgi:hypothetical protein
MTNHTAPPAGFDLDSVESVTSIEIDIVHPLSGRATGAKLLLAGPEHPVRRRLVFEQSRRLRAQLQATGDQDLSPEQVQEYDTDLLVAATLGWRGLREAGVDLPYSPEVCKRLYLDPKRAWLRHQVQAAKDRHTTFTQASAAA